MDNYVTGKVIKELRERKCLTQLELANIINVSDKTISKWETGKGLPDISFIEPLSKALDISVIELMRGNYIFNKNMSNNVHKSILYVCPVCGNIFHSIGNGIISCCGISLPELECDLVNTCHTINCDLIENEYYISIDHEMTKNHYISFIAYVTLDRFEMVKLYPESNAEARFLRRGHGTIYVYCNKDGLFQKNI